MNQSTNECIRTACVSEIASVICQFMNSVVEIILSITRFAQMTALLQHLLDYVYKKAMKHTKRTISKTSSCTLCSDATQTDATYDL